MTGQLGGPIYDHVYSIDIPAQRILLISLFGDSGTDFDLYLFNSTATTVYSTQGQVATSKGPTSSAVLQARSGLSGAKAEAKADRKDDKADAKEERKEAKDAKKKK